MTAFLLTMAVLVLAGGSLIFGMWLCHMNEMRKMRQQSNAQFLAWGQDRLIDRYVCPHHYVNDWPICALCGLDRRDDR